MSEELEISIEKKIRITELLPVLMKHPNLMKYFDLKSDSLLDEKIAVLESLSEGREIEEIPNFYEVFELLPKEEMWD